MLKGKYDNGNDNWLNKNGNSEEWYVMYHGTNQQFLNHIVKDGLREGPRHAYANSQCLITHQMIGKGVYFMNHIEVCENYSSPCQIGDSKYQMAIQVRVRPSALRQCQKQSDISSRISDYKRNNQSYDKSLNDMKLWDNDYFVVNKTYDIRPYRILLKNINRIERDRPGVIDQIFYQISSSSEDEESESKSKPIQLAQKELVQPLHFFQNPQNLTKQDPVKSSAQKYQFETECKDLFKKLEKENKLVNPLNLVINQNIDVNNIEVLFYVLGDQFRQAGRKFSKSLIPDERLLYSFHGQFAADSNDSQAYTLTLQETPSLTYKAIASDEKVRQEFLNNFRKSVSIDLKVSENQIQIVALEEGSIKVVFEVIDAAGVVHENENFSELKKNFPDSKPKLKLKPYFKEAGLSVEDIDQNYNMTWENHKFGDYDNRGPKDSPQPYFFPVGWKGYALKIGGRYGNDNENWLKMNGNKDEWYVMFHGTDCRGVGGIMNKNREINPGKEQFYSSHKCRINKQTIGVGVYFSNHIEVCAYYSEDRGKMCTKATPIGNQNFLVAFQSRVKPEALRQCEKKADRVLQNKIDKHLKDNPTNKKNFENMDLWNNDYFVVNKTCDIRPYRILLQKIDQTTGN